MESLSVIGGRFIHKALIEVLDKNDFAPYFSRSLIPYPRDKVAVKVYEFVGLYFFRKDFLSKLSEMLQSYLEKTEMRNRYHENT